MASEDTQVHLETLARVANAATGRLSEEFKEHGAQAMGILTFAFVDSGTRDADGQMVLHVVTGGCAAEGCIMENTNVILENVQRFITAVLANDPAVTHARHAS